MSFDQLFAVQQWKEQHGINEPSIKTDEDVQGYLKKVDLTLKNYKSVHSKKDSSEGWMTGELDNLPKGQMNKIKPNIEAIVDKTSKINNIPAGLLLTFASYEGFFTGDVDDEAISHIGSFLNKYCWLKGLKKPENLQTGIVDGKKVSGGFLSETAKQEEGSAEISEAEAKNYSDSRPYGYNRDPDLAEKITTIYNKLVKSIYG